MTTKEAMIAMINGSKVRSIYWQPDYFIYLDGGGKFCDENGELVNLNKFYVEEWELYKPVKYLDFPDAMREFFEGKKVKCTDDLVDEIIGIDFFKKDYDRLSLSKNCIQSKKWVVCE